MVGRPPRKGLIDHIISPVTCIFFVINLLFFVLGITSLVIGGMVIFDEDGLGVLEKMDQTVSLSDFKVAGFLKQLAIALMSIGGILFLVGFLGCCGVAIGNSCFIYMYCIIFSLLVVTQLAGYGYIYIYRDTLVDRIKTSLEDGVKTYQGKEDETASLSARALVLAQKYLKCCGVNGGRDFQASPWYTSSNRAPGQLVPKSCCDLTSSSKSTCPTKPPGPDNPYTDVGCLDALKKYFFSKGIVATIISVTIIVLQLVAICYAVIIEKNFADEDLAAKLYQN